MVLKKRTTFLHGYSIFNIQNGMYSPFPLSPSIMHEVWPTYSKLLGEDASKLIKGWSITVTELQVSSNKEPIKANAHVH